MVTGTRARQSSIRWVFTGLLTVLLGLGPLSAEAQSADGQDEVTLRDGGFLRGTIVSVEPNHQVVILMMGSGERRVVAWRDMDHFDRGKYPATVPTGSGQPEFSTPAFGNSDSLHAGAGVPDNQTGSSVLTPHIYVNGAEVGISPGTAQSSSPGAPQIYVNGNAVGLPTRAAVHVHLETSDHRVQLFRILAVSDDGDELRETVCNAPCDTQVAGKDGLFRVGGPGLMLSRSFTLSGQASDVSLRVQPGSAGRWLGGALAMGLGGSVLAGGVSMLLIGNMRNTEQSQGLMSVGSGTGLTTGGALMIGAGAAATVTGLVLIVTSRTRVSFLPEGEQPLSSNPLKRAAYALLGEPLAVF